MTPSVSLPSHYRDVRPMKQGGMGEILQAIDARTGRSVARSHGPTSSLSRAC